MSFPSWREASDALLAAAADSLLAWLPQILGALAAIALGWAAARLFEGGVRRLLERLGLDRLADRGLTGALRAAGIHSTASSLVARVLFWMLMLTVLLSVADALGLAAVTSTIDRVVGWLPNLIGAVLIGVFGLLLGQVAQGFVGSGAALGGLGPALKLGSAARVAIVASAGVLAIEQLGVDANLLIALIATVALTAGLAVGIAFALGARGVVSHVLAGQFLRQRLEIGAEAETMGSRGVVIRIGAVDTVLKVGERTLSIPNGVLLDQVVELPEHGMSLR